MIDFWNGQNKNESVENWARLVEMFNASQSDVYVNLASNRREDALVAALAANAAPLVTLQASASVGGFFDRGLIVPLEGALEKYGLLEALAGDVMPHLWSVVQYKGHVLGIPYDTNYYAPMVNMRFLSEAGLAEPPASWGPDEFLAYARALSAPPDRYAMVQTAAPGLLLYLPWVLSAGGFEQLLDESNYEARLLGPESRRVLDFIDEIYNRQNIMAPSGQGFGFGNGTVPIDLAISIESFAGTPIFQDEPDNVRIVSPPDFGHGGRAVSGGWSLMVLPNDDPEKVEAAWRFIRWLLQPDIAVRHVAATGALPTRRTVVDTAGWQEIVESRPCMVDALFGVTQYGVINPSDPRAAQVQSVIIAQTQALANEQITVAGWIENVLQQARSIYGE